MSTPLLPDALWNLIQPLLPPSPRRPNGGRPRLPDRACLTGILFVLRSGIPWEMLPQELGCGSGMTCWRRLRDWQEAGIWQLIHFSLLDWLARCAEIDWSRAVVDGSSIRAVFGGCRRDRIPPTGPSWATSAIKYATVAVFRSPFNSPEPTVTIRSKPSHLLTPSHPCRENGDDRAIVLIAY